MIQAIINILRRWVKFAIMIWLVIFVLSQFWQTLIFWLYHLNLSLYYFFGAYLSNVTLSLLTIWIVIYLIFFIYKVIKKVI